MLKRYTLKSERSGSGWAFIVIDTEIGFFATVSDFGNYSYAWSCPGGEFRAFLIDCDVSYLVGKLLHGRSDYKVYDGDATVKGLLEHLEEINREAKEETGKEWEHYEDEKAALARGLYSSDDFRQWLDDTRLEEAYEFARYEPCPQAVAFCEQIMPRFRKLLEAELEAEKLQPQHLSIGAFVAVVDGRAGYACGCETVSGKIAKICDEHKIRVNIGDRIA